MVPVATVRQPTSSVRFVMLTISHRCSDNSYVRDLCRPERSNLHPCWCPYLVRDYLAHSESKTES